MTNILTSGTSWRIQCLLFFFPSFCVCSFLTLHFFLFSCQSDLKPLQWAGLALPPSHYFLCCSLFPFLHCLHLIRHSISTLFNPAQISDHTLTECFTFSLSLYLGIIEYVAARTFTHDRTWRPSSAPLWTLSLSLQSYRGPTGRFSPLYCVSIVHLKGATSYFAHAKHDFSYKPPCAALQNVVCARLNILQHNKWKQRRCIPMNIKLFYEQMKVTFNTCEQKYFYYLLFHIFFSPQTRRSELLPGWLGMVPESPTCTDSSLFLSVGRKVLQVTSSDRARACVAVEWRFLFLGSLCPSCRFIGWNFKRQLDGFSPLPLFPKTPSTKLFLVCMCCTLEPLMTSSRPLYPDRSDSEHKFACNGNRSCVVSLNVQRLHFENLNHLTVACTSRWLLALSEHTGRYFSETDEWAW